MKKYFVVVALSLGVFVACNNNNDDDPIDTGYGDMTGVIDAYVDKTVLPTYEAMKNEAWKLYDAVVRLSGTGGLTDANLSAVCDQWRATRIPWEQSESFLFGPAEKQSLDPLLDSWPLNQDIIQMVLSDETYDDDLEEDKRGFHAIEFLVFAEGQARTVATFDDANKRKAYLLAVTKTLRNDCIKLWSSWAGSGALAGKDAEAMSEIGFTPESPSYAELFKNAGKDGNSTYMSQAEAIDAIVDGCVGIAEEVGAQKIGGPNGLAKAGSIAQAVLEVESWYSWNSITDYANNIESIRNSYLGGREGNRGDNLSDFIKTQNEALDTEILNAINKAYTAIKNDMQQPFREHLTGAEVDAAMNACAELSKTLEKIKGLKK